MIYLKEFIMPLVLYILKKDSTRKPVVCGVNGVALGGGC
jgi:enoyl-CoA hydratase/carnithine racemase